MKQIITSILLIFVSFALASVVLPIAFVYAIVVMCIRSVGDYKTYRYFYRIALGVDNLSNAVCRYLFNDILIKPSGYPFGSPQESISSVIGKNVERGTLRTTGKILNTLLNKIQSNHSLISIEQNVNNTE